MGDQIILSIDNVSTSIDGKLNKDLYEALKKELGYIPENALWQAKANPYFKGYFTCICYSKSHCRCAVKKDGMHFPTGLASKCINFFKSYCVDYKVIDNRNAEIAKSIKEVDYSVSPTFEDGTPFNFHDYQKETIEKSIKQQRGIIKLATGAGKTLTAAGIIAELGVKPSVFIVPSINLLRQTQKEFESIIRFNNLPIKVGMFGGGNKLFGDVNIMTMQTAVSVLDGKYEKFDEEEEKEDTSGIDDIKGDIADLIRSAKLLLVDESHHAACSSCQTISDNASNARWRFGMSATPYRDKGDDILIEACFGKTIIDINSSYLIERGFLVKPTIAFLKIDNTKGQKFGPYPSVYKNAIVDNDYRNNVICHLAENLEQKGRSVLILIQQIAHGETLKEALPSSVFLHGSCSKKEREEHLDKMREGKPGITIASSIFDEGIDVKPLNSLILAGGGKSSTRALQRVGRIIRNYNYKNGTKKTDAFVYDFLDDQKYLRDHSKARRKIYQTESLFDIKDFDIG